MIEKHGGLEDFVVDPFGFKYQVRHHFAAIDHVDEHDGKHSNYILGFMIFLSASYGSNKSFSLIEIVKREPRVLARQTRC